MLSGTILLISTNIVICSSWQKHKSLADEKSKILGSSDETVSKSKGTVKVLPKWYKFFFIRLPTSQIANYCEQLHFIEQ